MANFKRKYNLGFSLGVVGTPQPENLTTKNDHSIAPVPLQLCRDKLSLKFKSNFIIKIFNFDFNIDLILESESDLGTLDFYSYYKYNNNFRILITFIL